jgi:uncharacterized membrane protein YccC
MNIDFGNLWNMLAIILPSLIALFLPSPLGAKLNEQFKAFLGRIDSAKLMELGAKLASRESRREAVAEEIQKLAIDKGIPLDIKAAEGITFKLEDWYKKVRR